MPAKTCVITGASRGIGLATGLQFAKAGYAVVVAARNERALAQAAAQIAATGVPCETVTADVADPAQARRVIEVAARRLGRIDVLVNNAGHAPLGRMESFEPVEFDRVCALNMGAIFHTTRVVWPIMKQQGRRRHRQPVVRRLDRPVPRFRRLRGQ